MIKKNKSDILNYYDYKKSIIRQIPINFLEAIKKNLFSYNRRDSVSIKIGNCGMGGNNPIRIQSMTTTDTIDTIATVEESIRMIKAGCELVRITAPSKKEAENLKNTFKDIEIIERKY